MADVAFGSFVRAPSGACSSRCSLCAGRVAAPFLLSRRAPAAGSRRRLCALPPIGLAAAFVAGACQARAVARRRGACVGRGAARDWRLASLRRRQGPAQATAAPCELTALAISPQEGHEHRRTLIYLHGFCGNAEEYMRPGTGVDYPWCLGNEYAQGLRVVLPTAPRLLQPWGERRRAWYTYCNKGSNRIGNAKSLRSSRDAIMELVTLELDKLGGEADRLFLGGLSQGCTLALDVYLRMAPEVGLGGFVGSVGYMPSDTLGFEGADAAMGQLMDREDLAQRPLWLQCATDDDVDVPWNLVRYSLKRAIAGLPGLKVEKVSGRGHAVDDWEAAWINTFLRQNAPCCYEA